MVSALFCLASLATKTDLTFVRHGETIANATGKYNSKTIDTFSARGEKQVAALTQILLKQRPYDVIVVSPSPRALKTIAPYLRASNRQAMVWPLLYECCTSKRPADAHATKFTFSKNQVNVPSLIAPQFLIDRFNIYLPSSPDYNAGLAQVQATVAAFKKKYAGKRILVVGHSGHGGQFLKALTGKSYQVLNASPIHVTF